MDICAYLPPSSYGPKVEGGEARGGDGVSRVWQNRLKGGKSCAYALNFNYIQSFRFFQNFTFWLCYNLAGNPVSIQPDIRYMASQISGIWPARYPAGYPTSETGYPAGNRIPKKAGYPMQPYYLYFTFAIYLSLPQPCKAVAIWLIILTPVLCAREPTWSSIRKP